LANIINRMLRSRPQTIMPSASSLYKYNTRFALLGTVGSGKSTVAAGIILTAQYLSADDPTFYGQVIESNSDIIMDTSLLKRGYFPSKTAAYQNYAVESGLVLIWTQLGGLRERKIQIPICDIAGEDVQQMIRQTRAVLSPQDYNANQQLLTYIKQADGFLICVPASRALMFTDDAQLEREPSSDDLVSDPDVPVSRILQDIINYKSSSGGKNIKAIGVVVTKSDLMNPFAERLGIDLYTEEGLRDFLDNYFAQTSMTLKRYVDKANVRFFASHFQVMKNKDGKVKKWPNGGDRIELFHDIRRKRMVPRYSEQSYVDLFEWLRSFAT
jgi:GTPase SAR1 family protein